MKANLLRMLDWAHELTRDRCYANAATTLRCACLLAGDTLVQSALREAQLNLKARARSAALRNIERARNRLASASMLDN